MVLDSVISAGTILAVLLSVLLAHRLTVGREHRKELQSAVSDFKDAFTKTLTDLMDPEANPAFLITRDFARHQEAAVKLQAKLPKRRATKFSKAWDEYRSFYDQKASLGLFDAMVAEITDPSRAQDPEHIYEVNALRRSEATAAIAKVMKAADL